MRRPPSRSTIIGIIKSHLIVDIWSNEVAQNNMRNAIDDYFFDVLRDEKGIDLPVEVLDDLELQDHGPCSGAVRGMTRGTALPALRRAARSSTRSSAGRRKTLEIAVEPDASVVIAAPQDATLDAIEAKLRKRAAWVTRQQRYFAQFLPRTPERRFIAGETHLYLGRQYRLKVVPHVQETREARSVASSSCRRTGRTGLRLREN